LKTIKAKRYKKFILDPNGFFVINTMKDKILVDYYRHAKLAKRIVGSSAKEIRDTVDSMKLFKDFKRVVQHSIYLGIELEKAELAIKNKLSYIQDEELKLKKGHRQ